MRGGMERFLSEETICLHKGYLNDLRLRCSVMEKSFSEFKDRDASRIFKMRHRYKDEMLSIKGEILCHELFFNSFGSTFQASDAVRDCYRTEASFLYEAFKVSSEARAGYTVISAEKGRVSIDLICDAKEIFKIKNPILCIDLFEHSYFADYGFDKDRYISNLLQYLELSAIDKFLMDKD